MTIGRLLFGRRPPEIIRGVRPIVIDPVELQARRARMNIGIEVGKVVPSFADGDAAPSIPLIARCFRVIATLHHAAPYFLKGVFMQPMPGDCIALIAAARDRQPSSQRLTGDFPLNSTIAAAQPVSSTANIPRSLREPSNNGQAAITLAGFIGNNLWRGYGWHGGFRRRSRHPNRASSDLKSIILLTGT